MWEANFTLIEWMSLAYALKGAFHYCINLQEDEHFKFTAMINCLLNLEDDECKSIITEFKKGVGHKMSKLIKDMGFDNSYFYIFYARLEIAEDFIAICNIINTFNP